jgi:hypothetical protein
MLSVLPVTEDQMWLSKLRPELRDNIHHPSDATNTTPTSNPPTTANKTEDRERSIPQDYHHVGRILLSAAVDGGADKSVRSTHIRATRIPDGCLSIYCSWNSDN